MKKLIECPEGFFADARTFLVTQHFILNRFTDETRTNITENVEEFQGLLWGLLQMNEKIQEDLNKFYDLTAEKWEGK